MFGPDRARTVVTVFETPDWLRVAIRELVTVPVVVAMTETVLLIVKLDPYVGREIVIDAEISEKKKKKKMAARMAFILISLFVYLQPEFKHLY